MLAQLRVIALHYSSSFGLLRNSGHYFCYMLQNNCGCYCHYYCYCYCHYLVLLMLLSMTTQDVSFFVRHRGTCDAMADARELLLLYNETTQMMADF